MASSSTERRTQQYGFLSVATLTDFYSRWIPEPEITGLIEETGKGFRPRAHSSDEETALQKIQKAEFAIVRRLVNRNIRVP